MKITEEELQKITAQQKIKTELLNKVALYEAEKHVVLHDLHEHTKSAQLFLNDLESKYGKISIDLSTGDYEEIKDQPENESDTQD